MYDRKHIICALLMFVCTYIHGATYIHAYVRTYIRTHIRTYIHIFIHTYIHTCIHTYIHTYVHTYMLGHVLPCTHMYVRTYLCPTLLSATLKEHSASQVRTGTYIQDIHKYLRTYLRTDIHAYSGMCMHVLRGPWSISGRTGKRQNVRTYERVRTMCLRPQHLPLPLAPHFERKIGVVGTYMHASCIRTCIPGSDVRNPSPGPVLTGRGSCTAEATWPRQNLGIDCQVQVSASG